VTRKQFPVPREVYRVLVPSGILEFSDNSLCITVSTCHSLPWSFLVTFCPRCNSSKRDPFILYSAEEISEVQDVRQCTFKSDNFCSCTC
jgi:hypothetical protein